MEPNQINGLMAGIMFLLTGLAGLTRHFLLEPHLPPAMRNDYPRWLLHVAFGCSVVMMYAGLRYTVDSLGPHPSNYTGLSVIIAASTCSYQGSLLYDTWTRRPDRLLDDILSALKRNNKE